MTIEERNEAMARMRDENYTYREIGTSFDVTYQRVQQILKKMGRDTTRVYPPGYCDRCMVEIPHGQMRFHKHVVKLNDGRVTPEREMFYADLVADYLAGMRTREMSLKYRVNNGTPMSFPQLFYILRKNGIEPNRGGGAYARDEGVKARMRAGQKGRRDRVGRKKAKGWRADE